MSALYLYHIETYCNSQFLDDAILFHNLHVSDRACITISGQLFYAVYPFFSSSSCASYVFVFIECETDIDSITSNQCTNAVDTFRFGFG